MRLRSLTVALALACFGTGAAHAEDLLDAYRQARANDPVLAQADAQRQVVGEGVPLARAPLLPQISGSMNLQQSDSGDSTGQSGNSGFDTAGGHVRSRSESVSLDQSIFNLPDIANLRAAKSTAQAQDATYAAAEQDLYIRVATAYFQVLTDEDELTYAKANEEAYQKEYDQALAQYQVGLAAITNVYQADSFYQAAKTQTVTAENTLENDKQALTQITNRPVENLKRLKDDLPLDPPSPADPQVWVTQALETNPTVLSQKYNLQAAEHDVTAARAARLPSISASLSRGRTNSWLENGNFGNVDPNNGRLGTTIGVFLTVPIFSGGTIHARVKQSIYQRDSAQDALEIQRRQITSNTLNSYRAVLAAISQVQSGKAAVASGQKALDATRAGFQVGTETILDVLTAIQTLTSAESSYSQARHGLVLDKLLLKQAAGTINYKDLETTNALLQ